MFVNCRWRRRLQAAVGPGHGRRRAFGSPDREHGRDTGVAETHRDVTIRDPATGATARDPATDDTARDDLPSCRVRREVIRHAMTLPPRRARRRTIPQRQAIQDGVTGDGRYGTRRPSRVRIYPDISGNARKCPEMPERWSVIPDDV